MLRFVRHLFGNSFFNSVALYPLNWYQFLKNKNVIFAVNKKHIYKHCGDVCNDVILMPQFLEVVRQNILGVVGNVIYCFVANLTDFPAVKEFRYSVKIWQKYRRNRTARFLRHRVVLYRRRKSSSSSNSSSSSSTDSITTTSMPCFPRWSPLHCASIKSSNTFVCICLTRNNKQINMKWITKSLTVQIPTKYQKKIGGQIAKLEPQLKRKPFLRQTAIRWETTGDCCSNTFTYIILICQAISIDNEALINVITEAGVKMLGKNVA